MSVRIRKIRNLLFIILAFIFQSYIVLAQPFMSDLKYSQYSALWGFISLLVVITLLYIFWKEGKLQQLFQKQKEHHVNKPHNDIAKLDKFVRTQLNEGHSLVHIKRSLLESGWKKENITQVLNKYKK